MSFTDDNGVDIRIKYILGTLIAVIIFVNAASVYFDSGGQPGTFAQQLGSHTVAWIGMLIAFFAAAPYTAKLMRRYNRSPNWGFFAGASLNFIGALIIWIYVHIAGQRTGSGITFRECIGAIVAVVLFAIVSLIVIVIAVSSSQPAVTTTETIYYTYPVVSTYTVTSVQTYTVVSKESTTIDPSCDLSGSCVDISRRMEESLHDCSIYGRNDPRCLVDKCNQAWIEVINRRCPSS